MRDSHRSGTASEPEQVRDLAIPDTSDLTLASTSLAEQSRGIVVRGPDTCERAVTFCRDLVQPQIDLVHEKLDGPCDRAHALHRELTKLRGDLLRPLTDLKTAMLAGVDEWKRKEREAVAEKQRQADELAQKQAEQKQADELTHLVEQQKAAKKAGNVQLAAALKSTAASIAAEPVVALAPTVESRAPKVEGTATRTVTTGRVTDLAALLCYLAANPGEAGQAVTVGQAWLNGVARSGRTVPGVASSVAVKTAI